MERLIAAAGSSYEGRVWIGLYDQSEKWIWALNDWSLYGHNDWNFRNWRSGEPNDMRTHRLMCVVSRDGFWYDAYLRSTTNLMTWHDAVNYCRQHHTDLTSVRNLTENEMIQQKVPSGTLSWIGLYRHVWIWRPDNSHSDFSYWVDEHPKLNTGDCAMSVIDAVNRGKWVESYCSEKFHFMCQSNETHQFHIKLTAVKSSGDLNDPNVTEAILNVLQAKMNESGFSKNVKLKWIKKPGKNIFHKEEEDRDSVKTEL
ncbi:uncharacterized protein LOC108890729 [Lates calcarifer]|uniref:Uncharacterized protein LOC108890729 n=1 Tax=Lates calcarifer TaxID=8187 RepID=A0AAJ8BES5_LATCA|nr:uncharacterized protein LOC108890729 [Lates calcarifer]